jgi:hypothetical protein
VPQRVQSLPPVSPRTPPHRMRRTLWNSAGARACSESRRARRPRRSSSEGGAARTHRLNMVAARPEP